ncbi:MAG: nucleoside-diphosphate kinase [Candidatus Eisenbacteria bacterium]|nr:nucleoside-diphosphate kinase [Candidatus Eisenbacteria bacterium]
METTLMILKPDAAERNLVGSILARIEASGLKIARLEMIRLTPERARKFYHVHEGKPFIDDLVAYMSRGTVVVGALEGEDAITRWRELMGATNPANAAPGTIRKDFAVDIQTNTVHGSDSPASAAEEIPYFFPKPL